jgi:hypothetical protein
VVAIEGDRAPETLAKPYRRRPAHRSAELRGIGVEVPDVDPLFLRRPVYVPDAAGACRLDEQRHEIAMAHRFVAADVEDFSIAGARGSRAQERVSGVVHVHEVPKLRSVAEDRDLAALYSEPNEPADETLTVVLDQLARTVHVRQAQ